MTTVPRAPVVVFVPGVFDLLHRGHLNILWRAKQLGDVLVAGVVTDAGCREYKGIVPSQPWGIRAAAVERLPFVDYVAKQDRTNPTPLLYRFRPDIIVHGSDWSELREGMETVAELGIEYVSLPYTPGITSTLLREKANP